MLKNGRTAHSRFKIPLIALPDSSCTIEVQSELANLIKEASVVVFDEISMSHKNHLEAINRTFQDIMSTVSYSNKLLPFGGKIFVFAGDFRQVLPVVKFGSRADFVSASPKFCSFWSETIEFKLTKNLRINSISLENRQFEKFLINIGDGKLETDEKFNICIPEMLLAPNLDNLIQNVWPSFSNENLLNRVILAAKNEDVDFINSYVLEKISGPEFIYYSADTIKESELARQYPIDFLNSLNFSSFPNHKLILKPNVPVILLRNLCPSKGLCNGTRLICKNFYRHVIEAEIACGNFKGEKVFLPRISLIPNDCIVDFSRRQFPIKLALSMTINKSQGQSLEFVGLYLKKSVFTHGQLYVAFSRVRSYTNLKLLLENNTNKTKNIVFQEAL